MTTLYMFEAMMKRYYLFKEKTLAKYQFEIKTISGHSYLISLSMIIASPCHNIAMMRFLATRTLHNISPKMLAEYATAAMLLTAIIITAMILTLLDGNYIEQLFRHDSAAPLLRYHA